MPCFKGNVHNKQIIIHVLIKGADSVSDDVEHNALVLEDKNSYTALVDTGAQSSCINEKVVDTLDLQQMGSRPIEGVNGISHNPTYVIDLFIPIFSVNREVEEEQIVETRRLLSIKGWKEYMVSQFIMKSNNFDVILGMDILKDFSFYMHNNEFTICY